MFRKKQKASGLTITKSKFFSTMQKLSEHDICQILLKVYDKMDLSIQMRTIYNV